MTHIPSSFIKLPITGSLAVAFSVMVLLTCKPSQAQEIGTAEFKRLQLEEIAALTAVVPRIKVSDVTADEAAAALWKAALGRDVVAILIGKVDRRASKITFDLKDVPVLVAMDYIAEGSGCLWSIHGWSGDGLSLEFLPVQSTDDSPRLVYARALKLTRLGLKNLGLQPDANPKDVKRQLQSFGVDFGDDLKKNCWVSYDATRQTLAVAVLKNELPFVVALVRLANADKLRPSAVP